MSRWARAWRTRDWVAPPLKIGTLRVRPMLVPVLSPVAPPPLPMLSPQAASLPQPPPSERVG